MSAVNVHAVLSTLTVKEKASLLAGADLWQTVPIPEKGVPCVKTTDGPNGARGAAFSGGTTAACFPAACCVASTFDTDIARRIGNALAEETRSKGARCLLAPTVCMHRHPLGGRNFESFSEDPILAGNMTAGVICGIQEFGVAATIKHFAANEQETDRLTVDETISERALREIYLKPFEIAIKAAKPWAVMTSYNMVNGHHADSSDFLLKEVLRGNWGWDGLVMSDWGGTNSTAASLNAGLDLEMPGPARWRTPEAVEKALQAGEVSEATVDQRALRVLQFLERLGCFEDATIPDEKAINKPEHQALIREAGAKGIVLMKNQDNILPLTPDKVKGKKIALLGHAKTAMAHGGGSASVAAHYRVTPWDALRKAFGDNVELLYSKGAQTFRSLPPIVDNVVGLDGSTGLTMKLFEPGNEHPVETNNGYTSDIDILRHFHVSNKEGSLEGTYTATETAAFYFSCSGIGPSSLFINDQEICSQKENCKDAMGYLFGGAPAPEAKLTLEAGKEYRIRIHTKPPVVHADEDLGIFEGRLGVRVGYMTEYEHDHDPLDEAVALAKEADISIVFTGHETFWETEGQDQQSFNLPKNGSQDRLVSAVAAANPKTIVVNSTGVAVAMPWLERVPALVQAWFSGQECGNSIADVLTGRQNPEGHLTCTFPKRLEDCPAHGNFPGTRDARGQLKVEYKEGVFVGYRHFDRLGTDKVNFPFGHGLSYTSFSFSGLAVQTVDEGFHVSVEVANTGDIDGAIAVQTYVGLEQVSEDDPVKALAAFKKVRLQAGGSETITMHVRNRDLAYFDEATGQWVIRGGRYKFSVGRSAGDLAVSSVVSVDGTSFAP